VAVGVAVGAAQVLAPVGPVHGHPVGQSVLVLHESPQASGGNVGVGVAVGTSGVLQIPPVHGHPTGHDPVVGQARPHAGGGVVGVAVGTPGGVLQIPPVHGHPAGHDVPFVGQASPHAGGLGVGVGVAVGSGFSLQQTAGFGHVPAVEGLHPGTQLLC